MRAHEVPDGLRAQGFRTRRSFGLGGMSREATILAALVLIADGILGARYPDTLLVTVPLTLTLAGLAAARRHGMSALAYYWAVFAWRRANRAGTTSYRQVLLPQPYALDLPGVGASSVLVAAHDVTTGRPVGWCTTGPPGR